MNVWSEFYLAQGRAPELLADAPFTSKDIDFCGGHEAARLFATRVRQGRAKLATLDDATPNIGVVLFVDEATMSAPSTSSGPRSACRPARSSDTACASMCSTTRAPPPGGRSA
nr:hypothetical protein [Deltaproteobacteria bacterium]